MKRLVGGDYLLDLSPIEIEESVDGETYTSITDKSVLDQLTDLKAFIGKSGMIKPVWIKILNGETDELIVTRGSISTSDGVTFLIKVLLAEFILTLSVEFTQAETDDHTPLDEWYIDSNDAKYILVSNTQSLAQELADFKGDVSITGDLTVTGKINNEQNPSVKPIYCHPITIFDVSNAVSTKRLMFTCLIFNNSATPLTKSTFKDFVQAIQPAGGGYGRLMISGGSESIALSDMTWKASTDEHLFAEGWDLVNKTYASFDFDITPESVQMYDGVNKIN